MLNSERQQNMACWAFVLTDLRLNGPTRPAIPVGRTLPCATPAKSTVLTRPQTQKNAVPQKKWKRSQQQLLLGWRDWLLLLASHGCFLLVPYLLGFRPLFPASSLPSRVSLFHPKKQGSGHRGLKQHAKLGQDYCCILMLRIWRFGWRSSENVVCNPAKSSLLSTRS